MIRRRATTKLAHGQRMWPLLLTLLTMVLVPTVCVLWFMGQAIRNERLAIREKLSDVYRQQLEKVPSLLNDHLAILAQKLDQAVEDSSPAQCFAKTVKAGICDSVLIFDPSGKLAYPVTSGLKSMEDTHFSPDWPIAERAEFLELDFEKAAYLYEQIATTSADPASAVRALQAQARCLVKTNAIEEALHILTKTLTENEYRQVRDQLGRSICADGMLRALEILRETGSADCQDVQRTLYEITSNYEDFLLPSRQRVFLMQRLMAVSSGELSFPTFQAETLAATFADTFAGDLAIAVFQPEPTPTSKQPVTQNQSTAKLRRTHLPGILSLPSANSKAVALFRQETVTNLAKPLVKQQFSSGDVLVELVPPSEILMLDSPLLTIQAGKSLPGWQLALHLEGNNPLANAADQRISYYLWMGITVVIIIAALSLLVTRMVTRQMKLTRLKNDLIATVSHELKTPLASMRALVETLLEGRCRNEQQQTEYLELVARENLRLSRLIDNFLTFSRMERNKRTFDLVNVRPADVARSAVDSVRERFESAGCAFEVEIADDLPVIVGDQDALVTVLLNLLDNACKYSEDDKHIRLRVFANGRDVSFEVSDRGIGMPRRVVRRIFDRFYQADRKLSRKAGGCGLGLSITRFLVDVHGGRIEVASRPDEGSTFTVVFPAVGSNH